KEEQVLLLELMKRVQKECFERNHMSMEEYEQAMMQYENRLGETIEERIRIETRIANMLKIKGKRVALDEEKKRLIERMKSIQNEYLIKGNLETRVYDNMMKIHIKRLSEVQEEIATMEADDAVRREKHVRKLFKVKE
ncbi:MAG: hypothetical protein Q8L27_03710, partial [archaeon]|nr:hypothetical protein [archaeon]